MNNITDLNNLIKNYKKMLLTEEKKSKKDIIEKEICKCYEILILLDKQNILNYCFEIYNYKKDAMLFNNIAYSHLYKDNNYKEAEKFYLECIEKDKTLNVAYHGLIQIYRQNMDYINELKYIEMGIENCPKDGEIYNFKGVYYFNLAQIENALHWFNEGLKVNKSNTIKTKIIMNIGHLYSSIGRPLEAIEWYLKSLDKDRKHILAYENILLNIHYFESVPKILQEYFCIRTNSIYKFHEQFAKIMYIKDPIPYNIYNKQKIRIGFVTGDIVNHAVAMFTNIIYKYYKTDDLLYVYSSKNSSSAISKFPNIKYIHIQNYDTEKIIKTIIDDQINILIDLSGYTADNKLDVFANFSNTKDIKLVTYLGYPNNTGIKNHYRISDEFTEKFNNEDKNLVLMKRLFLCYNNDEFPDIKRDHIKVTEFNGVDYVIGCYAKLQKINKDLINIWLSILDKLKVLGLKVILLIKSKYLKEQDGTPNKYWRKLVDNRQDVIFVDALPNYESHLNIFNLLDLHLDTWPYSGTTITCESLYMNVPVVTLCSPNDKHVSRVSGSILNAMSMENPIFSELITNTKEEYIDRVIDILVNKKKYPCYDTFMKVMEPTRFINEFDNIIKNIYLK